MRPVGRLALPRTEHEIVRPGRRDRGRLRRSKLGTEYRKHSKLANGRVSFCPLDPQAPSGEVNVPPAKRERLLDPQAAERQNRQESAPIYGFSVLPSFRVELTGSVEESLDVAGRDRRLARRAAIDRWQRR